MSPLLLLNLAHAACQLSQTPTESGTRLELLATAEPLSCRRLTLRTPAEPPEVKVTLDGQRVRKDHLVARPGEVEIGLPELRVGDHATVDVALSGDQLEVLLGTPAPRTSLAAKTTRVWNVKVDPKHPGWGFADPNFAYTDWSETTEGPEGRTSGRTPGAAPQGVLTLAPGSFTLQIPGAHLVGWGSEGVAVTRTKDGLVFDAPAGGEARWRVGSVAGVPVIPDAETFVSGMDWRFSQVSLPEPAIPSRLATLSDPELLTAALWDEVRRLHPGWLPGPDVLHPRQLNRAWRSGWVTPVERALILDRMLKQGRVVSAWVLTGEHAELLTLTGYDHALVAVSLPSGERLLDPECAACQLGEVSTRLAGNPAVGAARRVPLAEGGLERTLALVGEEFRVHVRATGAAALWLREAGWGLTPGRQTERVAEAAGVPNAKITASNGLDSPGAPVELDLVSTHAPRSLCETPPPWTGSCVDL